MDANVQELTAKAEKLNIDSETPKYSTNWCDIPMEMRSECIQRMDFKTKMRLRGTSRTEKSLVESKKYHFDVVQLKCRYEYSLVTGEQYKKGPEKEEKFRDFRTSFCHDQDKLLGCLKQVLKYCEIDTFEFVSTRIKDRDETDWLIELAKHFAPFRFKNFRSRSRSCSIPDFILMRCAGLENVFMKFAVGIELEKFEELLFSIPSVINAKLCQFRNVYNIKPVFRLIEHWIEKDVEIGKTLQLSTDYSLSDRIGQPLVDRVISSNSEPGRENIRIRTNNDAKHILLKCDKTQKFSWDPFYYTVTVIPSNLLESEYEKNDQWVKDVEKADIEEIRCDQTRAFYTSDDSFEYEYDSD